MTMSSIDARPSRLDDDYAAAISEWLGSKNPDGDRPAAQRTRMAQAGYEGDAGRSDPGIRFSPSGTIQDRSWLEFFGDIGRDHGDDQDQLVEGRRRSVLSRGGMGKDGNNTRSNYHDTNHRGAIGTVFSALLLAAVVVSVAHMVGH